MLLGIMPSTEIDGEYSTTGIGYRLTLLSNRPHRGDGRYIQHGQKIHLSVLKRALYDQAVTAGRQLFPPVATYAPYPTITAHLAPSPGMPPTWQGLLQFANVSLALWEVV